MVTMFSFDGDSPTVIRPYVGFRHSRTTTLHRKVLWFQGGLVFKADRPFYHTNVGVRAIKNKSRLTGGRGRPW